MRIALATTLYFALATMAVSLPADPTSTRGPGSDAIFWSHGAHLSNADGASHVPWRSSFSSSSVHSR